MSIKHTKTGPIVLSSKNYPRHAWGLKGNQLWILDHGTPAKFWVHSPGLAGVKGTISLESVSKPGYFVRHSNWYLYLHKNDNSALFKKDATWRKKPNMFFKGFNVLQSFNYPNTYIRHSNYRLRLWKYDGRHQLFRKDTSFHWVNSKSYRRPSPPHQRYTYRAYYHSMSWHNARRYCIRLGGDLAYHGMKTAYQRKMVHKRTGWRMNSHYHIGLNDWLQERLYRYPDGTVVDNNRVGWNAQHREPNGGRRENFGSIWYNSFFLNDLPYNYRVPFICEFPVYKKRTLVYFLYRGGFTSNQGLNACRGQGGTLASDGMPFHKRRSLIGGMGCPNGVVHVGWNDKRRENHWVNSAGNREFSRAYLHWNNGHEGRQGRNENCAAMYSPSGKLFDIGCNRQRYWVMCQKLI